MIRHLHIENIAVIKSADIDFKKGFNILTGETGAGKSIIIGALNIILGNRVSKDMIRHGSESLLVSAEFDELGEDLISEIRNMGFEDDEGAVIIQREFKSNGKNICRVNGRPATVQMLKSIGKEFINIYGQHESYNLLSVNTHIGYIDKFADLGEEINDYRIAYKNMRETESRLNFLKKDNSERIHKIDLLRYQVQELESADIVQGEMDKLIKSRNMYSNSEKIINLLQEAKEMLNGTDEDSGGVQRVASASSFIEEASGYFEKLGQLSERISGLNYELEECASDLNEFLREIEYDPEELERVNNRLDTLYKLSRKYGSTEEEMLNFFEKAKKELSELEYGDERAEELEKEYNLVKDKAYTIAERISQQRDKYRKIFSESVLEELRFLDMPDVNIEVRQDRCDINNNGFDDIEILVSANKGESVKSIGKTASGGELSRIMLAIKSVVSDDDNVGTFIFDEVDTGVSGSAAQKIGLKLKALSKHKQVICITHLAQIAALADEHFLIKKVTNEEETRTTIKRLEFDDRKKELARIIGGVNISEITLKNAEEMLETANLL